MAGAGERGGFVLSDTDLDGITAAGVAILAESTSLASGYGPEGLGDSIANTQIDPEAGFAEASAYAVGVEGSDGFVEVWVSGDDAQFSFATEAFGDGVREDDRVTTAAAFAHLSVQPAAIVGGSEVSIHSANTFATSTTDLAVSRDDVWANGFAAVDSVGIRNATSGATTTVEESWSSDSHHMVARADGWGNDVTLSAASVSTSAQRGPTTINVSAASEGASTRYSRAVAEVRIVSADAMAIATARGTSVLRGQVMVEPSASTEIDVEGGLFRATSFEREHKVGRFANSMTMTLIRMQPGM